MKKLIISLIFTLMALIGMSQIQMVDIKPFDLSIDSLPSIKDKLSFYKYDVMFDTINRDILCDIYVENYKYYNDIGYLELFLGNNKLYYIRFTCYKHNIYYWACFDSLYNYYIIYWD